MNEALMNNETKAGLLASISQRLVAIKEELEVMVEQEIMGDRIDEELKEAAEEIVNAVDNLDYARLTLIP
jgi:hypothetical protein